MQAQILPFFPPVAEEGRWQDRPLFIGVVTAKNVIIRVSGPTFWRNLYRISWPYGGVTYVTAEELMDIIHGDDGPHHAA